MKPSDKNNNLSIQKQCKLLYINTSNYYYKPQLISDENLILMCLIDEIYLQSFDCGSRQIRRSLLRIGHIVSRHRVHRLMKIMGIEAVYQKPKTSLSNKQHKIYPYLLTDLPIIYIFQYLRKRILH